MMMNKGAQSAMEFLMTYGWAILVVLAAIVALAYFGLLEPQKYFQDRCVFPAGMDCLGLPKIDATNNSITFAIANNNVDPIQINGVVDNPSDDCASPVLKACADIGCDPVNSSAEIKYNEKGTVKIECSDIKEGKFNAVITIQYYNIETGYNITTTGYIKGMAK